MANSVVPNTHGEEIRTDWLSIQGGSLQWNGKIIQISNIAMLGSSRFTLPAIPGWVFVCAYLGLGFIIVSIFSKPIMQRELAFSELILCLLIGTALFALAAWKISAVSKQRNAVADWVRLDVTLNSGYTYHIVFHDPNLMNRTMAVLSTAMQNGGRGGDVYVDIASCTLQDCSVTVNQTGNEALVEEMRALCKQMQASQPMIADALDRLAAAMEQQDEPLIKKLLTDVTTGAAAGILVDLASPALQAALGLIHF